MACDLGSISGGWLELESDPGLFTLLLQDFGVKNVEVKEVYDLDNLVDGNVFGFVFLFKWGASGRRGRRLKSDNPRTVEVTDETTVRNIFFAHQIIPNSCATHALISILMNSADEDCLGDSLLGLKQSCVNAPPETKGFAIGNLPRIAAAHNKHACPSSLREAYTDQKNASSSASTASSTSSSSGSQLDAFHFASFVPINGRLYELDGLKSFPLDHGEIPDGLHWTEVFREVIAERIDQTRLLGESEEIRYNLMALVPNERKRLENEIKLLEDKSKVLMESLRKLIQVLSPGTLAHARKLANHAAQHDDSTSSEEMEWRNLQLDAVADVPCDPMERIMNTTPFVTPRISFGNSFHNNSSSDSVGNFSGFSPFSDPSLLGSSKFPSSASAAEFMKFCPNEAVFSGTSTQSTNEMINGFVGEDDHLEDKSRENESTSDRNFLKDSNTHIINNIMNKIDVDDFRKFPLSASTPESTTNAISSLSNTISIDHSGHVSLLNGHIVEIGPRYFKTELAEKTEVAQNENLPAPSTSYLISKTDSGGLCLGDAVMKQDILSSSVERTMEPNAESSGRTVPMVGESRHLPGGTIMGKGGGFAQSTPSSSGPMSRNSLGQSSPICDAGVRFQTKCSKRVWKDHNVVEIRLQLEAAKRLIAEKTVLLNEEKRKHHQYKIEDCRRTHDYDHFIHKFIWKMIERGTYELPPESATPPPKQKKKTSK